MSAGNQSLSRGEQVSPMGLSDTEIAEKNTKAILKHFGHSPPHDSSPTPPASEEREVNQVHLSDEPVNDSNTAATQTSRPRGLAWVLTLCAIYSSMFIYALDNTITADLGPKIANYFDSVDMLPWLSVGFTIGAFVALLPIGRLYARYNAKWVYIVNVFFFLVASAICGAAPTMNAIIVGRVFLGVAGSGVYYGIIILITIFSSESERPTYYAISGVVWSLGTVLGPVIGGAFEQINWRWAFYINLVIGGVFAPVYLFVLPSYDPMPEAKTWRKRAENFDHLGTVLLIASSISLVLAINFGGILYDWKSGSIIALFTVGGLLVVALVVQQYYSWLTTPDGRIFPGRLLFLREPVLLFLATIGSNAAAFIPIYYIPVYFQFAKGDTALEASVRLLPLIVVFSVTNLAQGYFLVKFGYYWPWFFIGGALELVGNVLLYRIGADTTPGYIYSAEVLLALGTGFCIQTPYSVIHSVISLAEAGLGVPFIMIAQYAGITIGLSISGAAFTNGGLQGLRTLLPTFSEAEISNILSGTSGSAFATVPEELRGAVIDIIVENLVKIFIPSFFGGALVFLVSLFLNKKNKLQGGTAAMVG